MKRLKLWLLIVALLTIGTLSLSQAQWNPDTTNFYPAKVIKEMFGVFEAIKVGTNLTAAEKTGSSTVVRGGKFVDSNIDVADIDGADIDGGTIDGVDLSATSADLNSPDIDGGTIDGVDLSATDADLNTPDIDGGTIDGAKVRPALLKLPTSNTNPSSPAEGDTYINTSVDSMRSYIDGTWRNIGQRGSGYYELIPYTNPQIRWVSSSRRWLTTGTGLSYLAGSGINRLYGCIYGFLSACKGT